MAIEIRVPSLGESITEATVGKWYKKVGDFVAIDEPIVELETDKVSIEVPSPVNGIMSELTILQGTDVKVGTLIGRITKQEEKEAAKPITPAEPKSPPPIIHTTSSITPKPAQRTDDILTLMKKQDSATSISPTKKLPHRIQTVPVPTLVNSSDNQSTVTAFSPQLKDNTLPSPLDESHRERRVPMSRLRRTIASRLQEVQQNTAMLTTFNEVDLLNIMTLRKTYKEAFFKKHDIKLGIMSFFMKALIHALKDYPTLNAEIDNNELVYKDYYHIGVAVGTEKGLVVPVVRDADQMRFDEIERSIVTLAKKARSGDLQIEELQGGTFSLTNGGIYGSLMSTPILNAPQAGILGMHKIQDRPIAVDGQVVIRPMMYIALTYDHRIIDGKDAVSFLVRIKESLENPERLFLDL